MRVPPDKKVLALFKGPGFCEACGRWCQQREPHHVHTKGSSGNVDVPINLISLGGPWDCGCHDRHHLKNDPSTKKMKVIVANRENRSTEDIEAEIAALRKRRKQ